MSAAIGGQQRGTSSFGAKTADPRNFGAKIDGVTDDTLAWQAAIDSLNAAPGKVGASNQAYGRLAVPSGKSKITCPLWLDVSHVELVGEGASSVLLGAQSSTNIAFPVIIWGAKRDTNWFDPGGGNIYSQLPVKFDAQSDPANKKHRIPTTGNTGNVGNLDGTAAGRLAIRSRPAANSDGTCTNPVPPDHFAMFWNNPLSHGAHDSWATQQVLCVESAFQYAPQLNTAMPAGLMFYGHGNAIDGGGQNMGPFALTTVAGTPNPVYKFSFICNENPTITRSFTFGDTTLTGIHQICVGIDMTQNSAAGADSGLCKLYASQKQGDGTFKQIPITRAFGTENPLNQQHIIVDNSQVGSYTFTGVNPLTNAVVTSGPISSATTIPQMQTMADSVWGAGNTVVSGYWNNWFLKFQGTQIATSVPNITIDLTNMGAGATKSVAFEPGFSAACNLHFTRNDYFLFTLFADTVNSAGSVHPVSDLICYGLAVRNAWPYVDNGTSNLPHAEVRTGSSPPPNTDFFRYYDTYTNGANLLALLPLNDPIHDASKTSNRFITVYHGGAGRGVGSLGMFKPFSVGYDSANTIGGCALRFVRIESTGNWGCAVEAFTPLFNIIQSCHLVGGWQGLSCHGGYDYKLIGHNYLNGDNCHIFIEDGAMECDSFERSDVGNYQILLCGSNFTACDIKAGTMDINGMKTQAMVCARNHGSYSNRIRLDNIETDNENSSSTDLKAIIWCEFTNNAMAPMLVEVSRVITGNIQGMPVLRLDGGAGSVAEGLNSSIGAVTLHTVNACDGFLVQVDGPNWIVKSDDEFGMWHWYEPVRNTNPTQQQRVEYIARTNVYPPPAGRWVAGAVRLFVWNPAAGGVTEYRCVTSGTGAWSSTFKYQRRMYVSRNGTEYQCNGDNVLNDPPPSARWSTLGPATAPVFKAASTLAP